jgi:hypothetical protein
MRRAATVSTGEPEPNHVRAGLTEMQQKDLHAFHVADEPLHLPNLPSMKYSGSASSLKFILSRAKPTRFVALRRGFHDEAQPDVNAWAGYRSFARTTGPVSLVSRQRTRRTIS